MKSFLLKSDKFRTYLQISTSIFTVLTLILVSNCGGDGESTDSVDNSHNEDVPIYIECYDGETSETNSAKERLLESPERSKDSVDWPNDLPACQSFDDTLFFSGPSLSSVEKFDNVVFPYKSIPCSVFSANGQVQIACPFELEFKLNWTWADGRFPFEDGDTVRIYTEYHQDDPPYMSVAVLDTTGSLLMLSAQSRLVDVMAKIDCVKTGADIESDYSCEYDLADAPPFTWPNDPDPDSTEWTRVFGESATGQFMGISWELENPADVATSEDGEYLIIAPVNYRGEFYSDTEIVEKGYYYTRSQFRIQIIKKWE